MRLNIIALVVFISIAPAALAQSSPGQNTGPKLLGPSDPESREISAAAVELLTAIGEGNDARARELFAGNPAQVELLDAELKDGATAQVTVTATVRNSGDRPGRDVIQAYVRAPGEIDHRLAGFGAIELAGGETGTVTFTLDRYAFRRWHQSGGQWSVPPGEHQVLIGRSSVDLPVTLATAR